MSEQQPNLKEILLKDLIAFRGLKIPIYQRPYKWKKEHVLRLLDDLYENIYLKEKSIYRVGSIIIHEDNQELNIVDGQQRLTTLSLILYYLGEKGILLQNETFAAEISKNNLKYNFQFITNWFLSKSINNNDFLDKLKDYCQFVLITVYKQDEAFQLFDSQNSRGKSLEPYDLLKAFHLREMHLENCTERELSKYARQWENNILSEDKILGKVLMEHLFRIRKWAKGESQYFFTKNDINEFKGISLHLQNAYDFELPIKLLDAQIDNAQKDKLFQNLNILNHYPFQICMPIINGKRFFEYVFYYIELYKKSFVNNEENQFSKFYNLYCNNKGDKEYSYWGCYREGDKKVKNLYENLCLSYIDRFSEKYFEKKHYEGFYKHAYILRINKGAISDRSIIESNTKKLFFTKIQHAYTPLEIDRLIFEDIKIERNLDDRVKGIDLLNQYFEPKNDKTDGK